jgi:pyruvate-formate lyase
MGHGFTNAADGLTAIRRLVFEQRRIAPADLLAALASDFEGAEPMRRQLADQPKFGNDDPDADRELVELWRLLSKAADEAGRRAGLPFLTVSSVNPGGYHMGHQCGATADGRRAGRPFAIGHAPTAGHDRSGLTALLNSLAKVDPANGGAASNIKLAKDLFRAQRAQLETLFRVFWGLGGLQAMVSVVNQADLVDALDHPERHPHLLVRLGGWTVRFVELERAQQEEIIRRSIY